MCNICKYFSQTVHLLHLSNLVEEAKLDNRSTDIPQILQDMKRSALGYDFLTTPLIEHLSENYHQT